MGVILFDAFVKVIIVTYVVEGWTKKVTIVTFTKDLMEKGALAVQKIKRVI